MSVFNFLKEYLKTSGLMSQFMINTDYNDSEIEHAGLFFNGLNRTGADIVGNIHYQANFILQSNLQTYNDYDRIQNSDFMFNLSYSLDQISGEPIEEVINGETRQGIITEIIPSNAMAYEVPTGDINDGVVYQLQIRVNYTIY